MILQTDCQLNLFFAGLMLVVMLVVFGARLSRSSEGAEMEVRSTRETPEKQVLAGGITLEHETEIMTWQAAPRTVSLLALGNPLTALPEWCS